MKRLLTLLVAGLACLGLAAQNTPQEEDLDLQYGTELLKPGTPGPDFTLQDIAGKPVTLSSFRGRKVVLVFWASWCPDCRAEVPALKAMHASADPGKVAFVSVSFDRTLEALQQFVSENYLPGVQLFDAAGKKESAVGAAWHVKWIPSLYLLDEEGKVVLGTVMIDKIAKALEQKAGSKAFGRQLCTDENCAL